MPLPKMSTNSQTRNECFTFNEVIAKNNAAILEEMTEAELHDIDQAIDNAMENGGEICSIRDLIQGQKKPKKLRKVRHLKPVVCVNFATREKGKPKPVLIKALVDSGASGSLVTERLATKLTTKETSSKQKWKTVAGSFDTTKQVRAKFSFPEFFENQILEFDLHLSPSLGNYDMILGQDVLSDIKMDPRFSTQCVEWDGVAVPFKDMEADPHSFYIEEHYTLSEESERIKRILDAKYEPANLEEIASDCKHLDPAEREELHQLLEKYKELFDGSLGKWRGITCDFELKEGTEPYHAKAFPIPKCHEMTLKQEVERLCDLGVLKRVNRSEWACPTFIIPKKDGTIRVISDFHELNKWLR